MNWVIFAAGLFLTFAGLDSHSSGWQAVAGVIIGVFFVIAGAAAQFNTHQSEDEED